MTELHEDIRDCIDTVEKSKARLDAIELELAERFGLTGNVREQLRQMDLENRLVEDRVVADWHCEISWHLSCYHRGDEGPLCWCTGEHGKKAI